MPRPQHTGPHAQMDNTRTDRNRVTDANSRHMRTYSEKAWPHSSTAHFHREPLWSPDHGQQILTGEHRARSWSKSEAQANLRCICVEWGGAGWVRYTGKIIGRGCGAMREDRLIFIWAKSNCKGVCVWVWCVGGEQVGGWKLDPIQ